MGTRKVTGLRLSAATLVLAAGMAVAVPGVGANANPPTTSSPTKPVCNSASRGTVVIDGGSMTNTTNVDLSANGGNATGDASGGNQNLASPGNGRDNNGRGNGNGSTVASAGNGGTAGASANGGAIDVKDVNSGGNTGNAISVGNTTGSGDGCAAAVNIVGGTVTNSTSIKVSADGGTAIADASGGDNNVAVGGRAGNGGVVSAGNGGTANASANGGAISVGNINSGGNSGNTISVGNTVQTPSGPKPVCCAPPAKPVPGKPVPVTPGKPTAPGGIKTVVVNPNTGGKAREVASLPSTGAGLVADAAGFETALLALGSLVSAGAAGTALRRRGR